MLVLNFTTRFEKQSRNEIMKNHLDNGSELNRKSGLKSRTRPSTAPNRMLKSTEGTACYFLVSESVYSNRNYQKDIVTML